MNLQTELLENRIAQLKVSITADALEQAKRQAARKLAKRVNIPGFRKGKAPYNIITRYLGEGAILEEAIDELGPKVYGDAIDQAELEPYGPGQLETIDNDEEDGLVLTFTVPLVPTIDLSDYREVRHEFAIPEVSEQQVDDVVTMMLDSKATHTVKEGSAASGDQVKLDILGEAVFDETDGEHADAPPFDQKNWTFVLGEDFRAPMPGFSAAIEGIAAGEERSFDLQFPEDDEDWDETVRGKTVAFTVTCHEVSSRELPELTDEFVKSLGEEGVETVEALRASIREDLETNVKSRTESDYADAVLDKIVEGARIEYPELMVEETIDNMVKRLEQQLSQQGMTLDAFLKMRQMTSDDLRKDYRDGAIERLKRSLVLGELVTAEKLEVDPRAVNRAIKDRAHQYAGGNEEIREIFEQYLGGAQARRDLSLELMTQQAYDRIVAIGKGEEPAIGPIPYEEEAPETEEATTAEESSDVYETEDVAAEGAVTEAAGEAPAEAVDPETEE